MTFRRKLLLAAGAEILVMIAVFVLYAMGEDITHIRARRALTFFMMLQAMVAVFVPLFAARDAIKGDFRAALRAVLEPVAWVFTICLSGPLLLALFFDRGGLGLWLLALVVIAGASLASAGLILALARLTRKPTLAVCLAATLLLLFEFQPLYTLRAIKELRGNRSQRLLIEAGVRTSWMGVAYAMRSDLWRYDVTSPTLYPPNWIGSDYGVNRPNPFRHFLEYLVLGTFLAGLGAIRGNREESEEDEPPSGKVSREEPSADSADE